MGVGTTTASPLGDRQGRDQPDQLVGAGAGHDAARVDAEPVAERRPQPDVGEVAVFGRAAGVEAVERARHGRQRPAAERVHVGTHDRR